MRTLASLSGKMSVRTKQMHESLVKVRSLFATFLLGVLIQVLTYHAALPSTICIGVSSFFFQMMGFHSSHIDGLIFIVSFQSFQILRVIRNITVFFAIISSIFQFACIPAVVNPFLSLYFVAPYRRYRCKERKFEL